jgi:pimeloyl-ACP methyl ester carboxylesterase
MTDTSSHVDSPQGPPWWHPAASLQRARGISKQVEKQLARQPGARLTTVVPRTASWVTTEMLARTNDPAPGLPRARFTPALVSQVAMDESVLALASAPGRMPRRADYQRVGEEMRVARQVMAAHGWLDDPASFHVEPPPLRDVTTSRGWALGQAYQRLDWESGFEPHDGLPGRERWLAFEDNRTAGAWVLRHDGDPRPWLVCIHGFGCGSAFMDMIAFKAAWLHHELGLNVAAIVLPVHGSRRPNRMSGDEFLGYELMNAVHGITQSVWDIRRLLSWVRAQDPVRLGVFGVSLGGLLTAMTAAFESQVDLAMAGIPIVSVPDVMSQHSPRHYVMRSIEHNILDGTAQDVHRVVSPLQLPVAAPAEARAIFAGMGDRLAVPDHARRLWAHWDEPPTSWFPGNHVGYLWSTKVWRFVEERIRERLLL